MTYQETLHYLFTTAPLFQQKGGQAYKEGLETTRRLDEHFGSPHRKYHTIHVAGTNGKGSTAHTIAAILQAEGYRVGLYTSPHLVDFRERIRVNGKMISEQRVIDFVAQERSFFEPLSPSFFELTTALAFLYFAEQEVDVAVIEVGLGGRLDCTNIIEPILSVITNISFDHTQFLGNTLAAIAREKAGIIKKQTPVVVGEATAETRAVFEQEALRIGAPLFFAEDEPLVLHTNTLAEGGRSYEVKGWGRLVGALAGECQTKNTNTILTALTHLPLSVTEQAVRQGFAAVEELTGLRGRWQTVCHSPLTICDTGHNAGGWEYLSRQLQAFVAAGRALHLVLGMVADKEVAKVLSLLPTEASVYFTQASVERALPAEALAAEGRRVGLQGEVFSTVEEAVAAARTQAQSNDVIYIGGSTFVVADFLTANEG